MKKIFGLSFLFLGILFSSCGDLPECIETQLDQFKEDTKECPGTAWVKEYQFQGQRVFVFNSGGCAPDKGSDVFDGSCTLICSIGGFNPENQECQGVNFQETATEEKVVWEN